ncbi:MAG: DUF6198 family protein [Clostridium perfringens]|nr:DUF6198 family protein [Clostridium perfringens]
MKEKRLFSGELALCLGLIFNGFATTLMVESGFGIASISSVPYTLSLVFNKITFGVWNYSFQCFIVFLLVLVTRRFKKQYIVSFFLAVIFGYFIDFFNIFVPKLPNNIFLNTIYFIVSFFILSLGICLLLRCTMPILPIDTFTREVPIHFNSTYKIVKTRFDLISLAITVILSLVFLKEFKGIGIGTVICALTTGKVVTYIVSFIDKRYYFKGIIFRNNKDEIKTEVKKNVIS